MFDESVYDIWKTIPRSPDLKRLCSKYSTTEVAIDVIKQQINFERTIDGFHKSRDFKVAIDATGDYAATWNGWKTTKGKKHPKFIAGFEKDILPKLAKMAKELSAQKKEKEVEDEKQRELEQEAQAFKNDLTKPVKALYDTCQEIMVDAETISSTVFPGTDLSTAVKKTSALASSIVKRIAGAKSALQPLVAAGRKDKTMAGFIKSILLDFKDIAQSSAILIQTGHEVLHKKQEPTQYKQLRSEMYVVGRRLHGMAKKLRDDCALPINHRSRSHAV